MASACFRPTMLEEIINYVIVTTTIDNKKSNKEEEDINIRERKRKL